MEPKVRLRGMFNLDADRNITPCEDLLEHARWMEEHWQDCIVAVTHGAACEVHTCFLGMDLRSALFPGVAPNPFETCVFEGADRSGGVLDIERCPSWDEAVNMHERHVRKYILKEVESDAVKA